MNKYSLLLLAALASSAFAQDSYHQGYVTKNGTYVAPHYQTAPDNTLLNNYSTRGNLNPYTGQPGIVNPYQSPSPTYQQPQQRRCFRDMYGNVNCQ
jgi:hypothetical protein